MAWNHFLSEFRQEWKKFLGWAGNVIGGAIITLLFAPAPKSLLLFDIIKQHIIVSLIIILVVVIISFIVLFAHYNEPHDTNNTKPQGPPGRRRRWLMVAFSVSMLNSIVCSTLLIISMTRPAWCPDTLCPPPLTCEDGVHDNNLEICLSGLQSAFSVIPGDPARYTPAAEENQRIAALRTDAQAPSFPYRVALKAHSLQKGHFGMLISQVALVVEQVSSIPRPLNVWVQGPPVEYNTNPYLAAYDGQKVASVIPATYVPLPGRHVQLAPGEVDQLDVQAKAYVMANIDFRIQITYRVTNESQLHTLVFPQMFEIVFSNGENWHEYRLQGGRFIPNK